MKDNDEDKQVFRVHVDGEGWVSVRVSRDAGEGAAVALRQIANLIDKGHQQRKESAT